MAMGVLGQWRAAGISGAAIFAGFGAWAVLMQRWGLPFLPSSVLSKSALTASMPGGPLVAVAVGMARNFNNSFHNHFGAIRHTGNLRVGGRGAGPRRSVAIDRIG